MSVRRRESAIEAGELEPGDRRVYCVAVGDLAKVGGGRLSAWLATVHGIELLGEQRGRERRRRERRVNPPGAVGNARRLVRNEHGRRVGERRGRLVEVPGPSLPHGLSGVCSRVRFVRHEPLSARALLSARSLRLVVRFQAGEEAAFSELHGLWEASLRAYFDRELGDRYEAEDAVQTIAVTLLGALGDFEIRPEVPFQAWLFRVAHSKLVNELRRQRRVALLEPGEIAGLCERERVAPDVAEGIGRWALEAMLARLSERQRQVVALQFVYDLGTADIAAALGISERAVREAQRRALASLSPRLPQPAGALGVLRADAPARPGPAGAASAVGDTAGHLIARGAPERGTGQHPAMQLADRAADPARVSARGTR
jgi:RNA polymerase sigma-70 factor (ECF subfamily)